MRGRRNVLSPAKSPERMAANNCREPQARLQRLLHSTSGASSWSNILAVDCAQAPRYETRWFAQTIGSSLKIILDQEKKMDALKWACILIGGAIAVTVGLVAVQALIYVALLMLPLGLLIGGLSVGGPIGGLMVILGLVGLALEFFFYKEYRENQVWAAKMPRDDSPCDGG